MKRQSKISKYFWIFKLDFKQSLHYFADYVISAVFIAVILFIFTNLWQSIYAGRIEVDGFTISKLIWYLALTEAIAMSIGWRFLFESVPTDIKSGAIANYLTKPLSYLGWYFSISFSKFINYFLIFIALGSIVTFLLVGPLDFSIMRIVPLILIICLAFALSFFIAMIFVALAFWLEDVTAFYWVLQKMLFILGGMLIPIELYPEFIRGYLYYLPVSFITYWPGKYFVNGEISALVTTLVGQIIWITLFSLIAIIVYKAGIKKVNINGG